MNNYNNNNNNVTKASWRHEVRYRFHDKPNDVFEVHNLIIKTCYG